MVNITYKAMQLYCDWMTDKDPANKNARRVQCRLATTKEWTDVFTKGVKQEGANADSKNAEANIKSALVVNTAENEAMPAPVYAYPANKAGMHNMMGNVCEVSREGSILGGSWAETRAECMANRTQTYTLPDSHVGFRIVKEILAKE